MDVKAGRHLLLRKLALSGALLVASAAYVWSQAGRSLSLPVGTASVDAPSAGVRFGTSQTVQVKDGEFPGNKFDARFGFIRVVVVVAGGRIVAIRSEEYPDHSPASVSINRDALPKLEHEVIAAQSVDVDVVTGATLTSKAWVRSLRSAIRLAVR